MAADTVSRIVRPIAEIERDWRGASEYMSGHYAAELIQAQRAVIERLRKIEEHAGLMRDTIEGLSAGHAMHAETVRASLRLAVKAYDEGAA